MISDNGPATGSAAPLDAIGFPPPLLGERAVRLPILGRGPGWVILPKPLGVLVDPLPGYAGVCALTEALRRQWAAGKAELAGTGIECVRGVYPLEPEVTGPVVLALHEAVAAQLRNAHGSGGIRFTFRVVGVAGGGGEARLCEAPIAYDSRRGIGIVSARRGKKARTEFQLLWQAHGYALWEARTDYLRYAQIRLHARELGLCVVGDEAMGGVAAPRASVVNNRRKWQGRDEPYYRAPMVWLHSVVLPESIAGEGPDAAPSAFDPPHGIDVFLARLADRRASSETPC